MSDQDIIDTIAEALTPWEQRTDESHCELQAREALAALRNAGYVITKPHPFVVTQEMLEDQPDLLQQIQRRFFGPSAAADGLPAKCEHVVTRTNDHWYACDTCGLTGSERWAILHQFPSRYEIRPISDGEPTYDDRGKFTGWTKRRCGEHRTVGDRARCHDCHDWCYPDKELACDGCRIADAVEADQ